MYGFTISMTVLSGSGLYVPAGSMRIERRMRELPKAMKVGVKPLLYCEQKGFFVKSTELVE